MHKYKIVLADDSEVNFESKHEISKMSCIVVKNTAFLNFDDANIVINTTTIKKLVVDGIEFKIGYYQVH